MENSAASRVVTTNRSVPTNTILPHLVYRNVAEAISWLGSRFGFVEHYRYGPPNNPQGAQVHLGEAWIMLEKLGGDERNIPAVSDLRSSYLTIIVANVDDHYEGAKAAGVHIVEDLNEPVYGERQYVAEDLDGHRWLFSQHARDISPADWGATVAE